MAVNKWQPLPLWIFNQTMTENLTRPKQNTFFKRRRSIFSGANRLTSSPRQTFIRQNFLLNISFNDGSCIKYGILWLPFFPCLSTMSREKKNKKTQVQIVYFLRGCLQKRPAAHSPANPIRRGQWQMKRWKWGGQKADIHTQGCTPTAKQPSHQRILHICPLQYNHGNL